MQMVRLVGPKWHHVGIASRAALGKEASADPYVDRVQDEAAPLEG
jgi:hypothetical protein